MDYTGRIVQGQKGELICRPTTWIDITKFFLLDYVLHAFTVPTPPGSGVLESMVFALMSIVLPFSSILRANFGIRKFSQSQSTDLNAAHEAGALCMVISASEIKGMHFGDLPEILSPSLHNIHGYHPVPPLSLLEPWQEDAGGPKVDVGSPKERAGGPKDETGGAKGDTEGTKDDTGGTNGDPSDNVIVVVPPWFEVNQLRGPGGKSVGLPKNQALWHNSSVLKIVVSIVQILYGCFELYTSGGGKQLERYGYAAYSLSVIPYILMSLSNLISSLFTPQYPTLYLVHYRGKAPDGEGEAQCGGEKASSGVGGAQSGGGEDKSRALGVQCLEYTPSEPVKDKSSNTVSDIEQGTMKPPADEYPDLVTGVVGEAYGDFSSHSYGWELKSMGENLKYIFVTWPSKFKTPTRDKSHFITMATVAFFFTLVVMFAPEYIIFILTRWKGNQSTRYQQKWAISWLVISQVVGPNAHTALCWGMICRSFLAKSRRVQIRLKAIPNILFFYRVSMCIVYGGIAAGAFHSVAKMILDDVSCVRI